MKTTGIRFVVLIILFSIFFINLLYLLLDQPGYYTLLARYLSPDHHLNFPAYIARLVLTGLLALAVLWWLATGSFVRTFNKTIKDAPVIDKLGFAATTVLLLAFMLHVLLPDSRFINLLYMEDHVFETVTMLCALAAAALLIASTRNRHSGRVRVILWLLAGLFFCLRWKKLTGDNDCLAGQLRKL